MTRFFRMRIVSGGQTGADRAALDFARDHGIGHGGWCPAGRWAEDGVLAPHYLLAETPEADTAQRTEWNVRDSDATVLFTIGATPRGGSLLTLQLARRYEKPFLHLAREGNCTPADELRRFLCEHEPCVLNVAGSRESEEPGIYSWVREVLREAIAVS